ncbi:MAG TPA: tyrosine-type recombinase/integrase [Ktedonobacteraceae bacterium]|nr:tyrosine-type recombinase/integrase [Ktedonobacteraceae bacterium]
MSDDEKKKSKKPRREYGSGSVYQRTSDNRWVASVRLPNGQRLSRYGDTEQEAKRNLKEAQKELERGRLVTAKDQTVEAFLNYWLEIRSPTLRRSTIVNYRTKIRKHVLPYIGRTKLQKLTGDMLQSLYSKLLNKKLSPNTVNVVHTILKSAFKDAVLWEKLAVNPCDKVKPPKRVRKEADFLTLEQALRLIEAAKGRRLECMITLEVVTGMRRGELFALHWCDIDFEKKVLYVRWSLSYTNVDGTGCKYVEEQPKTEAGKRMIPLPDIAIEALKQHKARQAEVRLLIGPRWNNLDLVFCNSVGSYWSDSYHHKAYKSLLKKAGLPASLRFHDLRHSAATILLAMGVNMKLIQQRMGHSDIRITLGLYTHVTDSMQEQLVKMLNEHFKKASGEEP